MCSRRLRRSVGLRCGCALRMKRMLSPSPIAVVPIRQQRTPIATLPPKRRSVCVLRLRIRSTRRWAASVVQHALAFHRTAASAVQRTAMLMSLLAMLPSDWCGQGCSVLCSSASDVAAEPARHRRRPSGSVSPAAQQAVTHRCATGYRPSQPCHRVALYRACHCTWLQPMHVAGLDDSVVHTPATADSLRFSSASHAPHQMHPSRAWASVICASAAHRWRPAQLRRLRRATRSSTTTTTTSLEVVLAAHGHLRSDAARIGSRAALHRPSPRPHLRTAMLRLCLCCDWCCSQT